MILLMPGKNNKQLSFSAKWFSVAAMKGTNRAGRCPFPKGIPGEKRNKNFT